MLSKNSISYVLAVKQYNAGLKDKISSLFKEFVTFNSDWMIDDNGHSVDLTNTENEVEGLIIDIYNGGVLEIHGDYSDSLYDPNSIQFYRRIEFELEDDPDAIVGKVIAAISDMYDRRIARGLTEFVSEKYLNNVSLSHLSDLTHD